MSAALVGAIAALLTLVAFLAAGGLRLERTTDVVIGLMLAGAAVTALALLRRPRAAGAPLYGAPVALAFAALAVFTAISITWSLAPSDSWIEADRTLAYLATFAGGVALARLAPRRWAAMLVGVGAGCLAICAWALITKVFPATLAADETYARLREPFAYWNSVGLMAAVGVPPMLWLAARRTGHAAINALAWPAIGVLLVCVMLAYSRGSLVALAAGLTLWFAVVPLRLRAAAVLAAPVVGAALVIAWAFGQDGLTTDDAPMPARVDAGHEFGALLLLLVVVLLVLGLVVGFFAASQPLRPRTRLAIGRTAVGVLALLPVIALIALATAPGGVDGQVSKAWHHLTDPNVKGPDNSPNRLTATSSVRARYWDEALKIHASSPWLGTGAGAYATARTRFRKDTMAVRHAHGYVVQTLADLGWAGLALSLLTLGAWAVAAARNTGLRLRDRGRHWDAERVGLVTLVTMVVIFGVHSTVDWTWFVPANAVAALLCAGWVAGRGPLGSAPIAAPERTAAATPVWPPPRPRGRMDRLRRRLGPLGRVHAPGPALAAALVLAIALVAAWTAYQPVRALHAGDAAFDRLDAGQPGPAAAIAHIASKRNPLSVDPLFELAAIEEARGRLPAAEGALERAVRLSPASAEAWRRLGRLQLSALHQPQAALRSFRAAYYLDPHSPASVSDVLEASRAVDGGA